MEINTNEILPDNKSQTLGLLDSDTNLLLRNKEFSVKIDESFANIGPKLVDSLPDVEPNNCYIYMERDDLVDIFELNNTSVETVIKYVKKCLFINHQV